MAEAILPRTVRIQERHPKLAPSHGSYTRTTSKIRKRFYGNWTLCWRK